MLNLQKCRPRPMSRPARGEGPGSRLTLTLAAITLPCPSFHRSEVSMPRLDFRRAWAGTALACAFSTSAYAQTLQFEATACATSYLLSGSTFGENGFTFSTTGQFGLASWCSGNAHYAGSPALFINTTGRSVLLTKDGGGAFFNSLD